jgi:hypothetical protein
MSNVLRVLTSAFAIAALLGISASAQARDYRKVSHRHAHVGHAYSYGYHDPYGYRGGGPYYGGPGYNAPARATYGYRGGTDSNGSPRGGSDVGQFGGGPGP